MLPSVQSDDGWKAQGNCHGVDPDLFYPGRGAGSAHAKAVCATCPVVAECLEFALTNRERFGVWGGKSERERQKMRPKRRYLETLRVDRTPKPWCLQTRWSYSRGCRCEPCAAAEAAYRPGRRHTAFTPKQAFPSTIVVARTSTQDAGRATLATPPTLAAQPLEWERQDAE